MRMDIIQKYERIIKSQQAILFAQGPPGTGKTAIFEYIAKKQGWNYIDLRLATRDSSEVIGIPQTFVRLKNGKEIPANLINNDLVKIEDIDTYFVKYMPPEWAIRANQQPTLVVFEELNRAILETRNAALQILLERRIGESFLLNKNVFFASTGNLGDNDSDENNGDGCEVEEFDTALKGRLFMIEHMLTLDEWKYHFANEKINPLIVSFLEAHPDHCFKLYKTDSFASYRGWTFLSNFIGKEEKNIEKIMDDVSNFGVGYVGLSYIEFNKYLDSKKQLTVKDILNNFDKVKGIIDQYPRDQINEVIENLKKINYDKITDKKVNNILSFLDIIHEDLRISYFRYVVNNLIDTTVVEDNDQIDIDAITFTYKTPNIKKFMFKLREKFVGELDIIKDSDEADEENTEKSDD